MWTNGKNKTVRLELSAPRACRVFVSGTFNDWSTCALPMTQDGDGSWRALVHLGPGRYEYKFVVDGVWCCDFGAYGPTDVFAMGTRNDRGTMNCVLQVEE